MMEDILRMMLLRKEAAWNYMEEGKTRMKYIIKMQKEKIIL